MLKWKLMRTYTIICRNYRNMECEPQKYSAGILRFSLLGCWENPSSYWAGICWNQSKKISKHSNDNPFKTRPFHKASAVVLAVCVLSVLHLTLVLLQIISQCILKNTGEKRGQHTGKLQCNWTNQLPNGLSETSNNKDIWRNVKKSPEGTFICHHLSK